MSIDFLVEDFLAEIPDEDSGIETANSPSNYSGSGYESPLSFIDNKNSPLSYDDGSFTNSPENFSWDNDINNDLWGSILDELSGNESESNDHTTLNDEPLKWTNNVDSSFVEYNCLDDSKFPEICEDFSNIQNGPMISMDDVISKPIEEIQKTTPNVSSNAVNITSLTTPLAKQIILKPIAVLKNPNAANVKSHIKIGNNIFAIIQNKGNTNAFQSTGHPSEQKLTKYINEEECITNSNENTNRLTLNEHDYADEDLATDTFESTGVSKGFGPGLYLTDEEKKLLELENVTLPEDAALTKEEEKTLKKVRRKIKNKQSAMESRRRRKEYIDNLERRVKNCTDANVGLKNKVDKLTEDNKNLLLQLKQLQTAISRSAQTNKTAQKGTCLAVLLLSFALFYLPFNPIHFNAAATGKESNMKTTQTPVFRSRTLLSIHDGDYDNETMSSMYQVEHDHNINESLVYTEEMKAKLEKLLISEDHDIALSKLKEFVASDSNYNLTQDKLRLEDVNVVELREEYLKTGIGEGNKK